MDRRKRKSQNSIFTALLCLLDNKTIEQLSVSELIKEADISRGTFYLNFEDKYDLLSKFNQYYLDKIFSVCHEISDDQAFNFKKIFFDMFVFLEQNHLEYKLLFTKDSTISFRKSFYEILLNQFENSSEGSNSYNMEFSFLCAGVVGFLTYWLENDIPFSVEIATNRLWDLLKHIPFFDDAFLSS